MLLFGFRRFFGEFEPGVVIPEVVVAVPEVDDLGFEVLGAVVGDADAAAAAAWR